MPTRRQLFAALAILCVATLPGAIYVWQNVPLVRFRPVRQDLTQRLHAGTDLLSTEQADRVEAVLRQYGQQCRRVDGDTVLITLRLVADTELLWNFTAKAGL